MQAPAFTRLGRLKLRWLYKTRRYQQGLTPVRTVGGKVWVDRSTLASDWETLREIFLPRKQPYKTDYQDATVVDLGAHKGYFGVYALMQGAKRVVSYEPEPRNFKALARSAQEHPNWQVHQVAVSGESGRAVLNISADSWTHSLHQTNQTVGAVTVDVAAINDVVPEDGRMIVKLDVEGAECDIADHWNSRADELFVEPHSSNRYTPSELVQRFRGFALVGETDGVLHLLAR